MPRWRRPMPSVRPARPPPMIVMVRGAVTSTFPPRNKQVAEQSGAALSQFPFIAARPERGEFTARESGADADGSIVAGDGVAADEREQVRAKQRPVAAARFNGDEGISFFRRFSEQ